jgi:hypothetical protein
LEAITNYIYYTTETHIKIRVTVVYGSKNNYYIYNNEFTFYNYFFLFIIIIRYTL